MPPILSTSHCEFNGTHLCAHARKTIPLAPIHSFTRQIRSTFIVSTIINLRFFAIDHTVFHRRPINSLFPSITFLHVRRFFLYFYFHFHCTLSWACGSLCEPRKFFSNSLFVHSFVCAITHLFLNGFQPNFYQHFSHIYPTCHTIFSL